MRLCYIANPDSIHTLRWVRYFADGGHEVYLIGVPKLRDSDPPSTSALQDPIPSSVIFHRLTAPINVRKIWYLPLGYAVRRLVREIQPDVLHVHQVSPPGWLAAMTGYHPLIITAWGSDLLVKPGLSWVYHLLARWVLQKADYVTCVSEQLAQVARTLGVDQARLEVMPWGIDTAVFHPATTDTGLRARLGLGPGPIVLSIRAMRPLYNPLDIAQAVPRVLEQVPEAKFVIRTYACDPDLLTQFQTILVEHGVAESVRYVGGLPDDRAIADLYRLADVAVSVPSSDGTPLSVLEALACGATLVLSDVPSLHEWIKSEREGLYVPERNIQALVTAIVRLLTDDALRRRLQSHGLSLIQQRADSRVWMARAEDMYKQFKERR